MIIDIYTHILPERFFREMSRVSPRLENIGARLRGVKKLSDLELRFAEMDEIGDYAQVISLPNPPLEEIARGETAAQLARYPGAYNNGREEAVLSLKDGAVIGVFGGNQPLTLSPRSETSFAVESIPGLAVTFAIEGEQITSLTVVNQAGVPSVYKRVVK